jgi:hypothetical protein
VLLSWVLLLITNGVVPMEYGLVQIHSHGSARVGLDSIPTQHHLYALFAK